MKVCLRVFPLLEGLTSQKHLSVSWLTHQPPGAFPRFSQWHIPSSVFTVARAAPVSHRIPNFVCLINTDVFLLNYPI